MMVSKNLNDKTYEEMISEAIAQIPLYSDEWTNYNVSDPGIMILENLSAFSVLQREEMNEVPDAVKFRLLKMAGFEKKSGCPARALLYAERKEEVFQHLPHNQKLFAQQICYELDNRSNIETGHIKKIYTKAGEELQDFSLLSEKFGIPGGVEIFGRAPRAGQELFLEIDQIPATDQELIFHVNIQEDFPRNAWKKEVENLFVEMEWMILTKQGFEVVSARDYTAGFLFSGGIYLKVPENAVTKENGNYLIKAVLKSVDYDIPPKVVSVRGLLTEAIQMDTLGTLLEYEGSMEITVNHYLLQENRMMVYVLEKDGAYHQYQEVSGEDMETGTGYSSEWGYPEKMEENSARFYYKERISETEMRICFLEQSEYKPCVGLKNGIVVSVNSMQLMMHRNLGRVYGYDRQRFELSPIKKLWNERLRIMLVVQEKEERKCYFISPEASNDGEFVYRYLEEENVIEIQSCGAYEGAQIYLAECVTYQGAEGNVVSGNEFEFQVGEQKYRLFNDSSDYVGRDTEQLEDVRRHFVDDINQAATIVTAEDCEHIVKNIPGLSIHKVRATREVKSNTIHVVIKPNSKEKLPGVSDVYRNIVNTYLDERRMLTSRIVVEEPIYVPIDVKGTIYVEKHFEKGEQEIRRVLEEMLDYTKENGNFGDIISYHQIFHRLEELECVGEIYELSLIPQKMNAVKKIGLDWKLNDNCLCYPGEIFIELNRRHY